MATWLLSFVVLALSFLAIPAQTATNGERVHLDDFQSGSVHQLCIRLQLTLLSRPGLSPLATLDKDTNWPRFLTRDDTVRF
jgi:hypothetical protein